jgi:hypothetical protein
MKVGAAGTTIALAGALAVVASGTTGAYFSDTKNGAIDGTIGSVRITTSGGVAGSGNGIGFSFTELAPGVAQQAVVHFTNTGSMAQDVYLTFPSQTALHALNNLKTNGAVSLSGGVTGAEVPIFSSTNLNDGRTDADVLVNSCATDALQASFVSGDNGCIPLESTIKIVSGLPAGGTGSFSFGFNYAASYGDPTSVTGSAGLTGGGVFNDFPAFEAFGPDAAYTGKGLPFQVVATEVNKTLPASNYVG